MVERARGVAVCFSLAHPKHLIFGQMEALVAAVRTGDVASVCVAIQAAGNCLEGHDSTGETPIVAASAIGHEDVVRVLLDAGASASALNQVITVFHSIVSNHCVCCASLAPGNPASAHILLNARFG